MAGMSLPDLPLRLDVVLLAAGWSRRMGGVDKRLLPVDGQPLVRRSAALYRAMGLPVLVVGRMGDAALAGALAGLDVTILANPDPLAEQGASARIGLAACAIKGDGVILALADQPLLGPEDMRWLIGRFAGDGARRIAIPRHEGQRGNPVILPADRARALRDGPPAMAPRRFIDAQVEAILWCDSPSPGFTCDIDTPADAARLCPVRPSA